MVFVVGTLLAWAVSLRLISNALFAAVAAYLNIWASVILGLLCLLGLYPPRASHTKQVCLQQLLCFASAALHLAIRSNLLLTAGGPAVLWNTGTCSKCTR